MFMTVVVSLLTGMVCIDAIHKTRLLRRIVGGVFFEFKFQLSLYAHVSLVPMLAGGDVAMAQQKEPLWQLCLNKDWAAVQQRIRDKDVEDINEKGGYLVSFHAIQTAIL